MLNKSKKSIISFMLAIVFTVALFSGFSIKADAAKTTKVTVEFWTISLSPTFDAFFNGLIQKYESSHPNVKVNWTDLPYDAIQSKLITSIAGGTSPDVVNLNTELALTLAGKDALVDLNKEATASQKSIYIKTLWDSAKINNSNYAFPWYGAPSILMYNKAIFKKAGIKTPPKTFDEMLALAKTVKTKTGAYICIPEQFTNMLFLNGIKLLNSSNTRAAFNGTRAVALLTKYKKAVNAGYIPKSGWGAWDQMLQQFDTGKIAMINSGAQSLKRIKDEAPNIYKNVEITTPMMGYAKVVQNSIMNLVVPKASKNHKEAIDFANYITNDANQLAFSKTVQIFPSTIKAAKDTFFKSNTGTLETRALSLVANELNKSADFSIASSKQGDIFKAINKVQEQVILGNTDIKKALKDAETEVNKILSQK